VNQERFEQGQISYRCGQYAQAAQEFLESAEPGIARGNGAAFHQAGNAFLQLQRYADAITVYQNALRDDTYTKMSAIYSNMAIAYTKLGDFSAAAESYELAASYPECEKSYRCYLGAAQAQMKLGNIDKAAIAYKKAALDVENPNRPKALYNLALCLFELNQPLSALESLKVALDFPNCENRGRVMAAIGIAYTMLDSDDEAVEIFRQAIATLGTEPMSPAATQAFAEAQARIAAREAALVAQAPSLTGEIRSIDTSAAMQTAAPYEHHAAVAIGAEQDVANYFAMSEADLIQQGKELSAGTSKGLWWKVLLGFFAGILVLALAALGAAYYFGLGYPLAIDVVYGALDEYGAMNSVGEFWDTTPERADAYMAQVVPLQAQYSIDDVEGRMNTNIIRVIAEDARGRQTILIFTLVRDGIGWKITSVTSSDTPNSETEDGDSDVQESGSSSSGAYSDGAGELDEPMAIDPMLTAPENIE